jgi:hypothetical protein
MQTRGETFMDELDALHAELNRVLTELMGENPDIVALSESLLRERVSSPLIITEDQGPTIVPDRDLSDLLVEEPQRPAASFSKS